MKNRTKISANDLEQILSSKESFLDVRDVEIESDFVIRLTGRKFLKIKFINCYFLEGAHFTMPSDMRLMLIDCDAKSFINISSQENDSSSSEITISECRFEYLSISDIYLDILRILYSKIVELKIGNIDIQSGVFSIFNVEVKEDATLYEIRNIEKIYIDNTSIDGAFDIKNLRNGSLSLIKTTVGEEFDISNSELLNITFDRFIAQGSALVSNSKIDVYDLESCKFEKLFHVDYDFSNESNPVHFIEKVSILSCSFDGGFYFNDDSESNEFLIINRLEINSTSSSSGDVTFYQVETNHCHFSGYNKNSAYIFKWCKLSTQFFFYQFINDGKIVFIGDSWTKTTNLFFIESYLGKAMFIGVNFEIVPQINFYDTDISQISFTSTKWMDERGTLQFSKKVEFKKDDNLSEFPHVQERQIEESENAQIFYTNRKELFRQLKSASERQNDRINALEFLRLEMMAYRKYLHESKNALLMDKFILAMEWTNDYGMNWVKPVLFAIGFTFLLGIPITFGLNPDLLPIQFWLDCNCHFYEFTSSYIRNLPQLLNPIHSLDKMTSNPETIPSFVIWIDYLQRLIVAFFIVQTISAFRKYIKK